jgi:hypothetical protein
MKKSAMLILVLLASSLCLKAQDSTVNRLADLYVKQLFAFSPESGTFYGITGADNSRWCKKIE